LPDVDQFACLLAVECILNGVHYKIPPFKIPADWPENLRRQPACADGVLDYESMAQTLAFGRYRFGFTTKLCIMKPSACQI
jgi:hypothetical protein